MSTEFPVIRVFSWNVDEIASPVGTRNVPGGSFAFKNIVSSGCSTFNPSNPATTSGILEFEEVIFDLTQEQISHVESKVAAITINLAASGTAISEMRLFLIDDTALQASVNEGLDRSFVQMAASGSFWAYQGVLPSGAADQLTTTIPVEPNVKRQDGTGGLVGEDDQNSSEFIYMNLIVPLGTPLGSYGVCGSGLLRFGLTFNYWANDFLLQFG